MSTLIEPIRVGLEEAVRRVTVQVFWEEVGRPTRSFEVITFMTDPAKLDAAVQAIGQLPGAGGQQNQQGQGRAGTRARAEWRLAADRHRHAQPGPPHRRRGR